SVDHATHLTGDDVEALAAASTVATLLPLVEFSTRQPYPDARHLIDAGVTIAIASDANPGSNYSSSMTLAIALAVREMGLTPLEALAAATVGGAAALQRGDVGHLGVGARGDLVVLQAPDYRWLGYRAGVPLVAHTVLGGEVLAS
ncbi:MAG TPA: amidohydrolase family protein, partial [Microcella sp.]|nr:amidohydrolase family protein [Microcella sp.]